jgi:hypothetical protein
MASVKKSANVVALGKAMRSARRDRGHNQESFAAKAGLDRPTTERSSAANST